MVSHNFGDKSIQMGSDSKMMGEALMGIAACYWHVRSTFDFVKNLYSKSNIDLLQYPIEFNVAPHEDVKWVANVIDSGVASVSFPFYFGDLCNQ